MKILPHLAIIFIFFGLFFLGKGMTGLVISQSCCFPPNCHQEYLCQPELEQPLNNTLPTYFGTILIIFGLILYLILRKDYCSSL